MLGIAIIVNSPVQKIFS